MRERVARTVAERDRLAEGIRGGRRRDLAVAGNFVLGRLPTPDAFERLAERGLVVRTFAHEPLLAGYFRATVSNPDANDRLLRGARRARRRRGTAARASGRRPPRRGTACDEGDAIDCSLLLDGSGRARVATGLGFLDHLLTALAFWWMVDLELRCSGDLWIDEHHTLEDCAIALGEALDQALGDRAGLTRFADAARRSTRPWPRRRSTSRDAASRASSSVCDDERVGQVPDEPAPPLPRHVRATRAHRPAPPRRGRGRPPPRRGGLQGDRARPAHRLCAAIPPAPAWPARRASCERALPWSTTAPATCASLRAAFARGGQQPAATRRPGGRRGRAPGRDPRRRRRPPAMSALQPGRSRSAIAGAVERAPACSACASACSCCSSAPRRATSAASDCSRARCRGCAAPAACRTWAPGLVRRKPHTGKRRRSAGIVSDKDRPFGRVVTAAAPAAARRC